MAAQNKQTLRFPMTPKPLALSLHSKVNDPFVQEDPFNQNWVVVKIIVNPAREPYRILLSKLTPIEVSSPPPSPP